MSENNTRIGALQYLVELRAEGVLLAEYPACIDAMILRDKTQPLLVVNRLRAELMKRFHGLLADILGA